MPGFRTRAAGMKAAQSRSSGKKSSKLNLQDSSANVPTRSFADLIRDKDAKAIEQFKKTVKSGERSGSVIRRVTIATKAGGDLTGSASNPCETDDTQQSIRQIGRAHV